MDVVEDVTEMKNYESPNMDFLHVFKCEKMYSWCVLSNKIVNMETKIYENNENDKKNSKQSFFTTVSKQRDTKRHVIAGLIYNFIIQRKPLCVKKLDFS